MIPEILKQMLVRQYGEELTEQIVAGMKGPRAVTLRANTLKSTAADVETMLKDAGIAFEKAPFSEDAFILPEAIEKDIWQLDMYKEGKVYLQSLSSMLPVLALDPQESTDILDMAAAPGGKTAQIAAMTHNKAGIMACEINKIRAEKLKYNVEKQGATRVNVMVRDARQLEDFFRFDQILLDAPCSGSGTVLESDLGSCKAFSEKLVKNSARTQLEMLKKAIRILKTGQTMVYSTCSILAEENERNVKAILSEKQCVVDPITLEGMDQMPLLPCGIEGALCIAPTALYEGFFMCRLKKTGR